jgi:segregation and condensation protein A
VNPAPATAADGAAGASVQGFHVHLDVFSGPFDLLLSLIGRHRLDVTEVALSAVTDEFVAYVAAMGDDYDLDQVTSFLVVAATLLDLKAARLLPSGKVVDEEDVALLEARDLLFARLLQYRAYRQVAQFFTGMLALAGRCYPRAVGLEIRYAAALPEVAIGRTAAELAELAARLREPAPPPVVDLEHLHAPRVSVREHRVAVAELLQELGTASFAVLCASCQETMEIVARFLALLELYRDGAVTFEQIVPLGELRVQWVLPPADAWHVPSEQRGA